MDYCGLAVQRFNDNARKEFVCLEVASFRIAPLRQDECYPPFLAVSQSTASLLKSNRH